LCKIDFLEGLHLGSVDHGAFVSFSQQMTRLITEKGSPLTGRRKNGSSS